MNDPIRFFLALTLFLLLVQTGFVVQYVRSGLIRSDNKKLVLQDFSQASLASRFFREKEERWPSGWDELLSADLLDRSPVDPWTQEQYEWIQTRPTVLGEWRIFENLGSLQPGPTVEIALQPIAGIAWNPTTGLYRPTSTPSLGVIDFESPSGLTPMGKFSISNTGEVSVWTVEIIEFTRGDANFDGLINIADPIAVLRDSFGGDPLDCRTAGDINGDENTNIADAVNLLSYLFEQSFTIQAPFPDCAFEPSVIQYDCQTIPDCP